MVAASRIWTVSLLGAFVAWAAWAQSPPQYEATRGISEFAFGALVKTERAHFYNEGGGCPRLTDACRRRAYLVRGDVVVYTDAGGNAPFVKAYYAANAESPAAAGWLHRGDLQPVPMAAEVPASTWIGRYLASPYKRGTEAVSSEIQISVGSGSSLHVRGFSEPTDRGQPVRGMPTATVDAPLQLSARGAITGRASSQPRGSCDLSLVLIGPYLAVDASGRECGGDGAPRATFQGLYVRAGAQTNAGAAAATPATAAATPASAPSTASVTPAAATPKPTVVGGFLIEPNTKRLGGKGYRTLSGAIVTLDGCRVDCAADAKCRAFEFRAGVPNERHPSCMLLDEPGSTQDAAGFTAGVRQ